MYSISWVLRVLSFDTVEDVLLFLKRLLLSWWLIRLDMVDEGINW